jgi:hypothetical protein
MCSLRRVYSHLADRLVLRCTNAAEDFHLHVSSCHWTQAAVAAGGRLTAKATAASTLPLPRPLQAILAAGPVSFCSWPACSRPLFLEACLEILPKVVVEGTLVIFGNVNGGRYSTV